MEVQSEINPYFQTDTASSPVVSSKNKLSQFLLEYSIDNLATVEKDSDEDYILPRKAERATITFTLEHSTSTCLKLVGQQLWRGAFLLADLLVHIRHQIKDKTLIELGAGVGLTTLVAGIYARNVVSTDLDIGDVIPLLRANINRNKETLPGQFTVLGLDWFETDWTDEFQDLVEQATVVIAADVVYDNTVTEAFVRTITKILSTPPQKTLYIALEKRYVFTTADLDTCAPCYEHLLHCLREAQKTSPWNKWSISPVDIDFPQTLPYERIKQLVLWKISA